MEVVEAQAALVNKGPCGVSTGHFCFQDAGVSAHIWVQGLGFRGVGFRF